jgi:hypothetical protein
LRVERQAQVQGCSKRKKELLLQSGEWWLSTLLL